MPKAINSISR